MKKLTHYTIYFEGIDKAGKDLVASYVIQLSKYKYTVNCRGVITQIAYDKLYNRNYEYDLSNQENAIYVLLHADKEDWEIRCKITKEPKISYEDNVAAFEYAKKIVEGKIILLEYNTSKMTPYQIAKDVVNIVNSINSIEVEYE